MESLAHIHQVWTRTQAGDVSMRRRRMHGTHTQPPEVLAAWLFQDFRIGVKHIGGPS